MSARANSKAERLQIRCDVTAKRKIERAAAHEHKTLSDFVVETALARAERVIEAHERETLSEIDWELFYAALAKPPRPNKALKAAFRRYAERTGNAA